jgi:hypothetical protein
MPRSHPHSRIRRHHHDPAGEPRHLVRDLENLLVRVRRPESGTIGEKQLDCVTALLLNSGLLVIWG